MQGDMVRSVLVSLLGLGFAGSAAYGAWHAVAYNAEPFLGTGPVLEIGAALVTLAALALLLSLAPRLLPMLRGGLARLERGADAPWIAGLILLALGLRLGFSLLVPPVQVSDAALYVQMAERLAAGQGYEIATVYPSWTRITYASWPPGLPFALTPILWLVGPHPLAPLLLNLVLAAVTLAAGYALAERVGGPAVARLAGLGFALSPNLVAMSGQASKELLLVALVTAAAWLVLGRADAPAARWRVVLAGGCIGGCALAQPAYMFAPVLPAFVAWLAGRSLREAALILALTLAGAAVVVAPWTARNWAVLGEPVLISTGGGSVLYRANHDLGNGGYLDLGEDLPHERLPETEQDRLLKQAAMAWIAENPGHFAWLVFLKHRNFLGDNAVGVYAAMGRLNNVDRTLYAAAKGATNLLWFATLLLLAVLAFRALRRGPPDGIRLWFMLLWFYLLSVHSLTESGSRHHIALSMLLAIWLALELREASRVVTREAPLPAGRQVAADPHAS
jgi:4-amino-4-deoxy-L-arabinose transferase-like glycosyltransferase